MAKNKKIRIKDIAEMADVSEGTVDRVIHNRGKVAEGVEKKVKAILEKTGYTPDPIAQSLRATKTYHIAVVMPDPEQDEYWEFSNAGIERARKKWEAYNLHIALEPFDLNSRKSFTEVSDRVLKSEPDAVLTAPVFYEESLTFFHHLQKADIPYILFNTRIETHNKNYDPLCFIGPNLYQSGRVAANLMHLALPGFREIAVMHIRENIERSIQLKEKENGFRDYFSNKNLEGNISTHSFHRDNKHFESRIGECIACADFNGIFVTTSSATSITAKVLKKLAKQNIILIGYDLLEQNIHFLKTGTINFIINQNPQYQAFQGLRYLVNYLLLNETILSADFLPIEIITIENYKSFLDNNDIYII